MRSTLLVIALVVACGDDGGNSNVDAAVDGPPGEFCGGRMSAKCADNQYCDFGTNACGENDIPGVCKPRPAACPLPLVPEPHCGCDNKVYSSECEVYAAGSDLDRFGRCAPPAGSFACGFRQCTIANQYCERQLPDVGTDPDGYTCKVLPICTTVTCACLASQPCGNMCTGMGSTGLTLTCPGG